MMNSELVGLNLACIDWLVADLPQGPQREARTRLLEALHVEHRSGEDVRADIQRAMALPVRESKRGIRKAVAPDDTPRDFAGHTSLADMIVRHIPYWRTGLKVIRGGKALDDRDFYDHELRALDDIEKAVNAPKHSVQCIDMHDGDDIHLTRGGFNETHVIWDRIPNGGKSSSIRAVSANVWKLAIDNELTQIQSTADSFDSPKKAIDALIDWHVKAATDPVLNAPMVAVEQSSRAAEKPVAQYYYKTTGCTAKDSSDPDCVCWHDEGTGPFPDAEAHRKEYNDVLVGKMTLDWRGKPAETEPVKVEPRKRYSFDDEHIGVMREGDGSSLESTLIARPPELVRLKDWYQHAKAVCYVLNGLKLEPSPYAAQYLPERDPALPAEEQGLFNKFIVRRVDKRDQIGGKHYGCRYFVLDVDHDPCAPFALTAYAEACEKTHPNLAYDLRRGWSADRREHKGAFIMSKGEVEMKAKQLRWLLSLFDYIGPKEDTDLVAQAGTLIFNVRERLYQDKKNMVVVAGLPEFTFIRMLVQELAAARVKHPGTNVTTIALFEEVGEVAKALLDERGDRVWKEAIQTAVMAMRVAIEGDTSVDGWRNDNGLGNHRQGYTEDPTIVTMRADMNGKIEG